MRRPGGDAAAGRRVVAIGTTSTRVLETAARDTAPAGWSDLYITPPLAFLRSMRWSRTSTCRGARCCSS